MPAFPPWGGGRGGVYAGWLPLFSYLLPGMWWGLEKAFDVGLSHAA